jgi:serine/threonine-protein kinase
MEKARPFILRALKINPDLEEAHALYGFFQLYNNWNFKEAGEHYRKSILSNNKESLALYADYLNFVKRHDEAYTIAQRLNQNDPFYPNSRLTISLYFLGRHREAAEFAESRLNMFRNYVTYDNYGFLMLNTGKYRQAIESFQQAMELEGFRYPRGLGWTGAAYARWGQPEKAMEIIGELKVKRKDTHAGSVDFFIAVIYAALGDNESAINWLNEAYDHHEMEMPWLITEPQFNSLHEDPRFQDLVRKMGFPRE